jgi:hypothetical protein
MVWEVQSHSLRTICFLPSFSDEFFVFARLQGGMWPRSIADRGTGWIASFCRQRTVPMLVTKKKLIVEHKQSAALVDSFENHPSTAKVWVETTYRRTWSSSDLP